MLMFREYCYRRLKGTGDGPYCGYGVIIVEVCQGLVCTFGNHFELSFGENNRDCDPYCDKVL